MFSVIPANTRIQLYSCGRSLHAALGQLNVHRCQIRLDIPATPGLPTNTPSASHISTADHPAGGGAYPFRTKQGVVTIFDDIAHRQHLPSDDFERNLPDAGHSTICQVFGSSSLHAHCAHPTTPSTQDPLTARQWPASAPAPTPPTADRRHRQHDECQARRREETDGAHSRHLLPSQPQNPGAQIEVARWTPGT